DGGGAFHRRHRQGACVRQIHHLAGATAQRLGKRPLFADSRPGRCRIVAARQISERTPAALRSFAPTRLAGRARLSRRGSLGGPATVVEGTGGELPQILSPMPRAALTQLPKTYPSDQPPG